MGLYERFVLAPALNRVCALPLVTAQRRRIVPQARGRVLEIGLGSGLNFPHYDPARVTSVTGLDPSEALFAYARARARGLGFPVELVAAGAEANALPDAAFDTVLVTYTLCSIPEVERALAHMRRVLAPGGRLLFCEHASAPDPGVRRMQQWLEPAWKRLAGGCHLTRDTPSLLAGAGFVIETMASYYVPKVPRFAGYHRVGSAHAG
ncbi:MAG: methyltransferase domain-containing protein [Burkholderiales bacterium]|nr:methyltransferase domain-containing protein [Burkholderiales bacterium]